MFADSATNTRLPANCLYSGTFSSDRRMFLHHEDAGLCNKNRDAINSDHFCVDASPPVSKNYPMQQKGISCESCVWSLAFWQHKAGFFAIFILPIWIHRRRDASELCLLYCTTKTLIGGTVARRLRLRRTAQTDSQRTLLCLVFLWMICLCLSSLSLFFFVSFQFHLVLLLPQFPSRRLEAHQELEGLLVMFILHHILTLMALLLLSSLLPKEVSCVDDLCNKLHRNRVKGEGERKCEVRKRRKRGWRASWSCSSSTSSSRSWLSSSYRRFSQRK